MSRGPDDSSTEIAERIDAVCVRFRANWTALAQPIIEDYLAEVPAPLQPMLLKALLHIEVELLRGTGAPVPWKEYRERFPGFSMIVEELDLQMETASPTGSLSLKTEIDGVVTRFAEGVLADPSNVGGDKSLPAHSIDIPPELPLPSLHPRYQILHCIGWGGMGVVYKALDIENGVSVAIKMLHHRFSESVDRLKAEFRTLCDLRHPNLVALHQLYVSQDSCFFTMEFVDGQPFHSALRMPCNSAPGKIAIQGPMTTIPHGGCDTWTVDALRRFCDAAGQVVEGVWTLHDAGFIHCDLKPLNVLVAASGRVVVLDLGLALKLQGGNLNATVPAPFAGTLAYMAPEQSAGQPLTCAADWFSFGVMLYQTLTGSLPFAGRGMELVDAPRTVSPVPPNLLGLCIPDDLSDLCLALLDPDARKRPGAMEIIRILSQRRAPHARVVHHVHPDMRARVFVGRAAELARLHCAFGAAHRGQTQIYVVHGESGQGKTRLVEEFLRRSTVPQQHLVLAGRCFERENIPYKAWDSVIDALVGMIRELDLPIKAWLGVEEQSALSSLFPCFRNIRSFPSNGRSSRNEPIDQRSAAFAALRRLVGFLSTVRKLIFVIDDVQWADGDSAALLRDVFVCPGSEPVVLIFTVRSSEAVGTPFADLIASLESDTKGGGIVDVREIRVSPLTSVECEKLVNGFLEVLHMPCVAQETIRTLSEAAAGHPLMAFALTQVYASRRLASPRETSDRILQLAIDDWISDLPADTQRLLSAICLASQPLSQRVALAVANVDDEPEATVSLLRLSGLISLSYRQRETHLMPFHDVVRERVADALDDHARAAVHGRLANLLEAEPTSAPEVLAHHFSEAGQKEKAANYFLAAGERASETLAFELAARMYEQAVALCRHPNEWECRILEKQADALAAAGCCSSAGDVYLRTAGLIEAPVDNRRLLRCAAYQYCISGQIEDGSRILNQSLRHFGMRLRDSRTNLLVRLLGQRSLLAMRGGLQFTVRTPAEIASELIERVDVTWETSIALTMIDTLQGALFQTQNLRLALAAGDPARIARACCWQATHLSTRGQRARLTVSNLLTFAKDLRKTISSDYLDALAELAGGITAYFLGDWQESTRQCESAGRIFQQKCRQVSWEINTAQAFWLWSLVFRGELKIMGDELPKLLDEAKRRGNRLSESSLANFGGPHVWLARDEPDRAAEIVYRAMQLWPDGVFHVQHFTSLAGLTQIDLYAGRVDDACQRMESNWGRLERSLFLKIEAIRIFMHHLRGRCSLALAARTRSRAPLLRRVVRDARRLERESAPWAKAMALNLRAGIAQLEGREENAAAALSFAIEGYARSEMRLFEMCARRARGAVTGSIDARRDLETAETWMRSQEIVNPGAMMALHCPGFDFS